MWYLHAFGGPLLSLMATPLGLYTILFSRLSTIHLLCLLVVSQTFYHIYVIAILQLLKITILHIFTHEHMKVLYRCIDIVFRNKCMSEVIW